MSQSLNQTMETLYITEMKSIQPYSTKDEYIYAMKEDLADWFNSMYATNLTANNFIDQLKNGVLICEHANNVMREAAFKAFVFNLYDLQQAGIINITNLNVNNKSQININTNKQRSKTPIKSNGQSAFAGEYLMYNQEPKMIMIAYDNITNFIKWCRYIVRVKECLMFETEDLTLCKNEKNFILCLLEVARFGSKFGIRVPTIIQLEQEIEREMELDKTHLIKNDFPRNRFIEDKQPNKEYIKSLGQNDDLTDTKSPSPPPSKYNDSLELSHSNDDALSLSFSSLSNSPSIDKLKDESSSPPSPTNASSRSSSPCKKIETDSFTTESSPISSLTSLTASISNDLNQSVDKDEPICSVIPVIKSPVLIQQKNSNFISLIPNRIDKPKLNKSNSIENLIQTKQAESTQQIQQQVNLHRHVCSIANKCTCEKKFLVDKIGEGKYRIGNTKNIVFIRILKNHIMVRVGGGWDTLENYLDKHDPCRCSSDSSIKRYETEHSNHQSNIILTPVKPTITNNNTQNNSSNSNKGVIRVTTINCTKSSPSTPHNNTQDPLVKSKSNTNINYLQQNKSPPNTTTNYSQYEPDLNRAVDFTDAHLVIERDNQGKHQIGKILLNQTKQFDESFNEESEFEQEEDINLTMQKNLYFLNALKHSNIDESNTYSSIHFNDTHKPPLNTDSIYSSSLISFSNSTNKAESMIRNKMKKLINKIPTQQKSTLLSQGLRKSASSTTNNDIKQPTPAGLLKFSRTNLIDQMQHVIEPAVYTETKLPPRILRKYQKERSITEAALVPVLPNKFEQENDIELSSSSCNSALGSSLSGATSPNSKTDTFKSNQSESASTCSYQSSYIDKPIDDLIQSKKQNSQSPKILIKSRNKLKKYKKSKTAELSQFEDDLDATKPLSSDFDTDSISDDSKLLLRFVTPSPILKQDESLNDSLEMIPTKLEEDLMISNQKNYDNDVINIENLKAKTNRAQWDKSRQQIDLMYFNFSKLNQPEVKNQVFKATKYQPASKPATNLELKKEPQIVQNRSVSQSNTNTLPSKRVKNLNLAKEKLYEMKKTIDAKVNLDQINTSITTASTASLNKTQTLIPKPKIMPKTVPVIPTATRTTPRKVKKRSGERSLTTGIITNDKLKLNSGMKTNIINASNTSINSICTNISAQNNNSYAKIQSQKMRSRTPNQLTSSSLSKMHKTSASLHNISNYAESVNETQTRNRNDSFSSTASSFFGSSIAPNDYKENKAYELRKKSTLMNKIITKNKEMDPIYTRSHPICTEIVEHKLDLNNITIGSLGSYEQKHSAARKRLFAKKSEKNGFDPNLSICSNASSSASFLISPIAPVVRQSRAIKPTAKKVITPRSKSNNDLYYELERTNSEQDLIELLNNCDAPAGDLNQYKVMLSECEKLQFHINKLKSQHKMKKSCALTTEQIVSLKKSPSSVQSKQGLVKPKQIQNKILKQNEIKYEINEIKEENESSLTSSMHRRSLSLPSYIAIPVEQKLKNMQ